MAILRSGAGQNLGRRSAPVAGSLSSFVGERSEEMGRINRRRDRWMKRGLEWSLRPFLSRPRLSLEEIRKSRPRRVLLVRQHNQMGDMLCATPAFEAVAATFDGAQTLLVTAPVNDGVVRGHPAVDAVLLFDKRALRKSPRRAWRFLRTLRSFEAEVAVVLNSVSFSSTSAWIASLSGAPYLVGGSSVPFGWSFSQWLYNLEMPTSPELRGHAIDHGLSSLAEVGFEIPTRQPRLCPGPAARRRARDFLDRLGPGLRVALHPGAGKEANRWPPERFAAIAQRLREQGAVPYLIEGPADAIAVAETQRATATECEVLRGVDVASVAAVLERSDAAVVNDTGIMHIAGAVGVATVALFGPTPREEWAPPSPALVALQSPTGEMSGLDLDEVEAALWTVLDGRGGLSPRPRDPRCR